MLKLVDDGKANLIWPVIMSHVIEKDSPLYHLDSQRMAASKFEIVVTLTGSSHSTGQVTQARTSYLPHEIIWSHRFENIIHYDHLEKVYYADYENFDAIYLASVKLCFSKDRSLISHPLLSTPLPCTQLPRTTN